MSSPRRTRSAPYVFPYIPFHGRHYPLVPVTLTNGGLRVNTFALIDSGATLSVFRPEIAQALGFHKTKRKTTAHLGTAGGAMGVHVSDVTITLGQHAFPATVGFARHYDLSFSIIGREDFFDHFVICFDEKEKSVTMMPQGG